MDNNLFDNETTQLIVQTYQKIKHLKNLLNHEPYSKIKEIFESGLALNKRLNEALNEESRNGFTSNLNAISEYLENLISNSKSIEVIQNNQELTSLFQDLSKEINLIQSKIDEKQ